MKYGKNSTDKDEGRVQVLVVLFGVIAVELCRLPTVHGEEVGSGIVGPQWFGKLFEDGMEADWVLAMIWVSRL